MNEEDARAEVHGLYWLSVEEATERVAEWPEWKRNYKLTKYSKGFDNLMKPASAKNKGRRLQQWMRDLLISSFNLHKDDVKSTSMGAGGEDVQLSPRAREVFPYSIECKNKERMNLWDAYDQAKMNAGEHEPLVIWKKNKHKPLAVVDAEYFVQLVAGRNDENNN